MGIDWLVGKRCSRVSEHYPENTSFEFEAAVLSVDCLWRIVADNQLALTSQDHGHQYGLPAPLDVIAEACSRLIGRRVKAVTLREQTADLRLDLEGGILLEVLSNSSGYEPWNLHAPGIHLVARGGGGVCDFSPAAPRVDHLPPRT